MDYAFALFVLVISFVGLAFAAYMLFNSENDKETIQLSSLSIVTFFLTAFLAASMLAIIN